MRWSLIGLSLVLAASLTLIPVASVTTAATLSPQELVSTWAQPLVTSLGCTATVRSIDSSDFNAYFDPTNRAILLAGFDKLSYEWQLFLVLHETGHCVQQQNDEFGVLRARGPYEVEWDADAYAIKKYGELTGKDGADLNQEIWATLYQQDGYDGDANDSHGLSTERITRGFLNRTTPHTEGA